MESQTVLHLALFGLSEVERHRIRALSTLSKRSARTYAVLDQPDPEAADILIVDGEDPQVVAQWQVVRRQYPMLPTILIGQVPDPHLATLVESQIRRPLMATRLLTALNRIQDLPERPALVSSEVHTVSRMGRRSSRNPPDSGTQPEGRYRALVLDDSLPIRRQMEIELQRFRGLIGAIDLAETGEEAVELLSDRRYDIAFLDVVLPGIDGYQVCKRIKQSRALRDTKVVMLTSKSSPFDRIRGKLAGCDAYLVKPVDQAEFEKVMATLIPAPDLHPIPDRAVNAGVLS